MGVKRTIWGSWGMIIAFIIFGIFITGWFVWVDLIQEKNKIDSILNPPSLNEACEASHNLIKSGAYPLDPLSDILKSPASAQFLNCSQYNSISEIINRIR